MQKLEYYVFYETKKYIYKYCSLNFFMNNKNVGPNSYYSI